MTDYQAFILCHKKEWSNYNTLAEYNSAKWLNINDTRGKDPL